MNRGIMIAGAGIGLGLLIAAGGGYLFVNHHNAPPVQHEEPVLPKTDRAELPKQDVFPKPVPSVVLTPDLLTAKGLDRVPALTPPEPPPEYKCTPKGDWNDPNCPKADADQVQPVKVVHHHKRVAHKAVRHKRRVSRPASKLKSKWAQPQAATPSFSLERLFNANR